MNAPDLAHEHLELSRRYFLTLAGTGAMTAAVPELRAEIVHAELKKLVSEIQYLTPSEKFRNVERHRPLPYKLPPEKRLEIGLERETWKLEIIPDPDSNSRVGKPLTKADGTALDFPSLMKIAETKAVRFFKVMTCNNLHDPLGMGLWEGVPLRDAIWLSEPDRNIRRVFYRGYHNDNPKQIFQSSLPIGRVLEDPPGEQPVILCYKLNGKPLTGQRGGPVRMIVPDAYGFKSVKWIQQIYLTNLQGANDTYAEKNNDVDSKMKSFARFITKPKVQRAGRSIPLTGVAQAGMSGLSKVQYWLRNTEDHVPPDDRYYSRAPWQDAELLPPPKAWDMFPDEKLPAIPFQVNEQGEFIDWPPANTIAHWAALIPAPKPGKYELRCRAVDANGVPQPMPRPFQKSGGNLIQMIPVRVFA
ncbi:MAG: hypothetical protein CMO80_12250 [Verrucomicrobiales bacterium]|nr:hypothetical protein [Verrucomicrobiales bacterium]